MAATFRSIRSADPLRRFAFKRRETLDERPASVALRHQAALLQIAQQVHHEERVAFGLVMDQRCERGRERVPRKRAVDVHRHRFGGQGVQRDFATHAARLQIELERKKRMLRQRQD